LIDNNVTAASINEERSNNGEWKTADERVFLHDAKFSSLPADPSHYQFHTASTMASFSSDLRTPMDLDNSRSLSAVNVDVDSSQNSSTAASDSMEQLDSIALRRSPGSDCID